ncbi:tetraacyldisaccharide 4'-kinase [Variovorax sp. HJSM1_2]|uniref:tetraacyldisaccharide 4'-kinase n=1 Tax=Variovorax sp. HJSM1_2 TaxID=3366263 RepID=UPI003BE752B3
MSNSSLESALVRAWNGRGLLACALWPWSLLYRLLSSTRRVLYQRGWRQSYRAPVPVIVVGNVVAGGSGKTPVVMGIVQHLRAQGITVGVVSRGHGRQLPKEGTDCREVTATSPVAEVGDEPALIQRSCQVPVFVARRRPEAVRALLAAYPLTQVIVCDDGLQHYPLQRDVEICVFDNRGAGNGWLLPAGPLREAWPRKVDLILHTGSQPAFTQPAGFRVQRALAPCAQRADGSTVALATLRGQPVTALAGIGQPQAFFRMLEAAGLQLSARIALPDHYDFQSWQRSPTMPEPLICTEKDAVKLWQYEPTALAVALQLQFDTSFFAALDARLAQLGLGPVSSSTLSAA